MEQDRQDILIEEALRWFVLLRDPQATDRERQDFAAWLANGPAHAAAWARAQHVWSQADRLQPHLRANSDNIVRLPAPVMSRRQWLGGAAAAAVAVGMFGGYAALNPRLLADHKTGVAERRTISLADGSVVELGSASALSVSFSENRRLLTLHEGEAFFTVAADPTRPFVVVADNGRTTALGTAFNVKRLPYAVVVSVAEHAVRVAANGDSRIDVSEGEQVRYGHDGVSRPVVADLGAVQSWRRNRLVFADAPLSEVIADLERYRPGRIVITDKSLAALPVTAVFNVEQTDQALQTINDTLPVRVRRVTDLLVLISLAG